ncbi:MAG: NAD(P)-dependent oxidoreductase [Cognaticolwellia sp.]|jgi:3-hydroxyisobutyrate dehydrogenase-like beta-hydroxyacid dehydrogenase
MINVAFIGLGVMGYPMAGHLVKAGYKVTVYNRTHEKALAWQKEHQGDVALTPKEAAKNCELVFICVGNDEDVRSVVLGTDGALAGMNADTVLVDHTTASAELARELNQCCLQSSIGFIDAPVSGGQAGAENGALTIMCGGSEKIFKRAEPIMAAYARFSQLMGDVGSGQLAKMVNQICFTNVVQGLAEGLNFAQKAGLDTGKLIETISKGAAGSWQMDNRGETMCAGEFDFGFAVDWVRKDLSIAFAEAEKIGAELPVTKILDGYYQEVQEMGGSRWDTSSLIARLQK